MLDGRFVRSQIDVDVYDADQAIQGARHVSHAGAARHPRDGQRRCADLRLVPFELFHTQGTHWDHVHYSLPAA
jgi:hypothetical protein